MTPYIVAVTYKYVPGKVTRSSDFYAFVDLDNAREYAEWERENDDVHGAHVYKRVD